jgi:hypothetical protein
MPNMNAQPSSSKKTAAKLEAELAAMEEEEVAEACHKQERKEKKKKVAELAEARKTEEAAAVVVEAVWKAAKNAAKRQAELQEGEGKVLATKKKKATEEVNGAEELAQEVCQRCVTTLSRIFLALSFFS